LDGIKRKLPLKTPVEENIFGMTSARRKELGIERLPGYLFQAVDNLKVSALAKETLGEHTFEKFIANKKIEWDEYRSHVSDYELEKYLPVL